MTGTKKRFDTDSICTRPEGAKPVIVSSVTRRRFGGDGRIKSTLGPWAEAAKAEAEELDVPFIDLHAASVKYHNKIGPEASMSFNSLRKDTTHFNAKGAAAIADLIVKELPKALPELAARVNGQVAKQ